MLSAAAGCATGAEDSRFPALSIDYTWKDVPACSTVSPRIVVRNVPAGTARFRVELVDKDSAFARHGGGEVAAEPGGVIPPGALKAYRGPCPSQVAIMYEFRVWALDAGGTTLARGAEAQSYTTARLVRSGRR